MLLTLQFAEEERLATPPLSIQANSDGRVERGLTQNVCQSTAVHLISKQVLTIISIQISWQKGKRTKWVTFSPTKFSLVSKWIIKQKTNKILQFKEMLIYIHMYL